MTKFDRVGTWCATIAVVFVGIASICNVQSKPEQVQLLTLDNEHLVLCHGGAQVHSDGEGIYTVTYPAIDGVVGDVNRVQPDGSKTTVYGVHHVEVSTLPTANAGEFCK